MSDLGPTQLKNIAEPVRVYSLEVGKSAQAKPTKPAARKQRSIFVLLGAGIVALIAIAGGAWYFFGANRPATVTSNAPAARADAAHLSIVVLPFTNLSRRSKPGLFRGRHHGEPHYRSLAHPRQLRDRAQHRLYL